MSAKLVRTEEPSIYRRGEAGSFVVIVRAGDRQVKRSAKTMSAAKKLKSQLQTDVGRGELDADSGITFRRYYDKWKTTFNGRTNRGIRPNTLAEYRNMIERHALPYFGGKRLRDIRPLHIRSFADYLADQGLQPGTVKVNIAPLRSMLATAVEDGVIRTNPCASVRLAERDEMVEEECAKALTDEQLAKLINQVPVKHRLFITFMARTGVRISEAIALRWGDLDLPNRRVRVRRRIYRGTVASPKSRHGRRTIPLSPELAEALTERLASLAAGEDDLIFPTSVGTAFSPANFASEVFKPAAKRAGVGWASFHTLRHSYASALFRNGKNAVQVSRVLGHSDPGFTLRTYVHLLDDDLPDVAFLDGPVRQTPRQTDGRQTEPEPIPSEEEKTAA
jgi:integrase